MIRVGTGKWIGRLVKIAAAAVLIGGVIYWLKFAPALVLEHRVESGEITAEVMGTGTLEAHFKCTISPRIAGRLQDVLVDQGDRVKAGDLLVRLDDVDIKPQVEVAQASVEVAQAALDRLQADRVQALAILEQAAAEYKRGVDLRPKNAISQSDLDKVTAEWRIAQAGVSRTDAALVEARKQRIAAETNLAYRKALLADSEILAPLDGLIVQRFRDAGDIAVPGAPVLSMVSTKELWITAWMDETEIARVAEGQPARVVFRSEPERAYRGEVARMGRQADRETREFTVDVRVLELPEHWAVGQRAEVYVQTARKANTALVPSEYIVWRDRKPGVFFRSGAWAVWREVSLGLSGNDVVEIASGVVAGDRVVVSADGKNAALQGRRVAPQ